MSVYEMLAAVGFGCELTPAGYVLWVLGGDPDETWGPYSERDVREFAADLGSAAGQ